MPGIVQTPIKHDDMNIGNFQKNQFGDRYFYIINRNMFDATGSDTVFQARYGEALFNEDTLYVIAGTDSGLLIDYVRKHGLPTGTRYFFIELSNVINKLNLNVKVIDQAITLCTLHEFENHLENKLGNDYALVGRFLLKKSQAVKHGYFSDYLPFWRQLKKSVDQYCWRTEASLYGRYYIKRQIKNLTENQFPAYAFKDRFVDKTAVLLAGGPSLDQSLAWVKANRDSILVTAVSRIGKQLTEAGICPDIIVSIDPQPANLLVSKEMLAFQENALLVNSYHVAPELLSMWHGRKVYLENRYPWNKPGLEENFDSRPPTVTNTAHWLLVEMGFKQIILLGVDLCFSSEGFTHAKHSLERNSAPMLTRGDQLVETISGQMLETTNEYIFAATNLDEMAKEADKRNCITINPSENSVKLANIRHLALDNITIDPLEQPAMNIIDNGLPKSDRNTSIEFHSETLEEVERVIDELKIIKKLAIDCLRYNKIMFGKNGHKANMSYKHKMDQVEKKLNSKHKYISDLVKCYGIRRFIAIVRFSEYDETDIDKVYRDGQTYYQAYLDTASELCEELDQACERITARIEEQNESPDIDNLLAQWKKDRQYGRALNWKQKYLASLNSAQIDEVEKLFVGIADGYEQVIKEQLNQFTNKINKYTNIDGLQGKALEYLQQQDTESLRRLISGVSQREDSSELLMLIQAYLSELNQTKQVIIENYIKIQEGPFRFDVLRRLLLIYTRDNDYRSALPILAQLAEITPNFVPALADVLHILGEPQKAVDLYTDYLLLSPDNLHAMFKLGKIYKSQGLNEGLEWTMQYILEKDPENKAAKDLLLSLPSSSACG